MTITTTKRKAGPYHGDGVSTMFPFDFKIFDKEDLFVIYADESGAERALALQTDYTVNKNIDQETIPGGNVILKKALPHGTSVTLTSGMAYLQPTKLTNHGGFYPAVLNDSLDRLTIFVQQLEEQVERSVKVTVSSNDKPDDLITAIKNSESAARQSAQSAREFETSAVEHAQIAKNAADALEDGLNDLAGVKAGITEVRTDVDDLQKAIVPATRTEIQNGQAGRLVDAAGLKRSIAMQEEINNGNTGKLVDAAGLVKYMSDRFAIIYPNGGSEENPANITFNSRYILNNPFPGNFVQCRLEVIAGLAGTAGVAYWGDPYFTSYGSAGWGGVAHQFRAVEGDSDVIILQTGTSSTAIPESAVFGNSFGRANGANTAWPLRCRILVYRID